MPVLKLPERPVIQVIERWAPHLAVKLGRPVDDILSVGLTADDFSPAKSVEIRDPSGWLMRFGFAFSVVDSGAAVAVVFTENSGYFEFSLPEDGVVVEIFEEIYRQR